MNYGRLNRSQMAFSIHRVVFRPQLLAWRLLPLRRDAIVFPVAQAGVCGAF
jgi:hypothetical protein